MQRIFDENWYESVRPKTGNLFSRRPLGLVTTASWLRLGALLWNYGLVETLHVESQLYSTDNVSTRKIANLQFDVYTTSTSSDFQRQRIFANFTP